MKYLKSILIMTLSVTCISCGNSDKHKNAYDYPLLSSDWSTEVRKENQCSKQLTLLIGNLFYYANPFEKYDDFKSLTDFIFVEIVENEVSFSMDSPVIRCMKQAGEKLTKLGKNAYSREDADYMYASASEMGSTLDQAQLCRNDVNTGAIDALLLGRELIWLSNVIPNVARGDTTYLHSTGTVTRKQLFEVLNLVGPEYESEIANIRQNTLPNFTPHMIYRTAIMVALVSE